MHGYNCKTCGQKFDQEDTVDNEVSFLSKKIIDLNKRLMESEKNKSLFLSLVANELNNPMSVILGLVPKLSTEDPQKRQKIVDLLTQEALHLDFHIQNLMAAAEIEGGLVSISSAKFDIQGVVNDTLEYLRYWINENELNVEVTDELNDKIVSDPAKLYLILKNLIANASQHSNHGSTIHIKLRGDNDTVFIDISNTGDVPKVENKAEIFTRFANGPASAHGLGIGLSIVRGLCEFLEGSIDFDIHGDTVVFTVSLPRKEEGSQMEAEGEGEFFFDSFDDAVEL